jgi:hypothetical protein
MRTLYVDTATNRPWDWGKGAQPGDQPHLLRLAACFDDGAPEMADRGMMFCTLVTLPAGERITAAAAMQHGIIETEYGEHVPISAADAMARFIGLCVRADVLVAHSAAYHRRVLQRTAERCGLPFSMPDTYCTMTNATSVVQAGNLQGNGRWKWPTIGEAYQHFAGDPLVRPVDPVRAGLQQLHAVRTIYLGLHAAPVPSV